ncbi:riboflavin synthase [Fictibacillus terranigra]|uniref:Riboflavin synthase n=1 Tax=Fictibacillus terranigra TaxID=3058424 RepID=A0ABT8ECZ7_9BACL|nr:riboflavin synthase [Fictibacillus sp. CENA-BCM004]MDN4075779.1 riboflavin synthase [Fictibacillus sp. CENA-BCM004]
MFTGIIEELGTIESIKKGNETIILTISASAVLKDVQLGDSISVNGVCLTVTAFSEKSFTVDVMPETYRSTGLKGLSVHAKVNLERAMASGGRFGGHFVSGHIDGTGEIVQKRPEKNAIYYDIKVPEHLAKYLLLKGSVAVDGTSLTIFGLTEDTFTISLIPHTVSHTVLGAKGKGDSVNIECDMLGKYVEKFLAGKTETANHKSAITMDYLTEHGF